MHLFLHENVGFLCTQQHVSNLMVRRISLIFGKENMLEGNNGTTGFFSTPHVIEVAALLSSLHNSGVEFSTTLRR